MPTALNQRYLVPISVHEAANNVVRVGLEGMQHILRISGEVDELFIRKIILQCAVGKGAERQLPLFPHWGVRMVFQTALQDGQICQPSHVK